MKRFGQLWGSYRIRWCGLAFWLLLASFLASCSGISQAPVIERSPGRVVADTWKVRKGDSLYAIAWATGLDYRKIVAWNKLQNPDLILAGQTLHLRPPPKGSPPPRPIPSEAKIPPKPKVESPKKNTDAAVADAPTSAPLPFGVKNWAWPADGKIIAGYSPKRGINGIQIGGEEGSPVRAAAEGNVVYAGEGLRGYGRLIILKHSAEYLSAYAHNQKIMVKEGERVKPGQTIASMGSSGTDHTKLYFEIRKNGDTVNPQSYLPKSS